VTRVFVLLDREILIHGDLIEPESRHKWKLSSVGLGNLWDRFVFSWCESLEWVRTFCHFSEWVE